MFDWLRRRKADREAAEEQRYAEFAEAKQRALEHKLGPLGVVYHAPMPVIFNGFVSRSRSPASGFTCCSP